MPTIEYYLPSTTKPGAVWRVFAHKPPGRPAYASAVEGEPSGVMSDGATVYGFVYPQPRQAPTVRIEGRASPARKEAAVQAIAAELRARGWARGTLTTTAP